MKQPKTYIILLLLLALFIGCKKYAEGGTKWNRKGKIAGSSWTIETYTVDGIDSLDYLNDSILNCNDYLCSFSDADAGPDNYTVIRGNDIQCANPGWGYTLAQGSWSLSENNIFITVFKLDSTGYGQEIFSGEWQILRLKSNNLWIEQERSGKNYDVRFLKD